LSCCTNCSQGFGAGTGGSTENRGRGLFNTCANWWNA